MIAVLGGVGAAFAFAVSTLCYSRSSRLLDAFTVVGWVMLVGAAIVLPLVLLTGLPANLTAISVSWLALVGIGNVGGLLLEFRAFRTVPTGVVATIASTEGAIAAAFAVLAGEPLSLALSAALAVVAVGVFVTTITPGEVDELERPSNVPGLALAIGAAVLFGMGLFATGRVDDAVPVVWAVVPARLIGVFGIAAPLAARRRLTMVRPAVPLVVIAGISEIVGFGSFAIGARESVAVAAVLVSQFATIALIAGRLFFGERLSRLQAAGVVTVIAGVAAVVLVQA